MKSEINSVKWFTTIKELAVINLKLKYKGTVLGFFWSFLEPLLFLFVFYFMFTNIFGITIENFVSHLFVGLIFFYMFVRGTSMSLTSISSNAHIVGNLMVPKIIFPLSFNLMALLMMVFDFTVFFVYLVAIQFMPPLSIILLPVFIGLVFIFSLGVSLPLAVLSIKLKDLQYIWTVITGTLIFLTPIFWNLEQLPENVQEILQYSPWVQLVTMAQNVVIYNEIPDVTTLMYVVGFVFAVLGVGFLLFKKFENRIMEDL